MLSHPIAIVGMGCVLPGAKNTEQYWQNCLEGKSAIAPISNARWDASLYLSSDKFDIDKTYSVLAAEIDNSVYEYLNQKFKFKKGEATRMQLILLESASQALGKVKIPSDNSRIGFILGAMSPDEDHFFAHARKVDRNLLGYLRENLKSQDKKIVDDLETMINEKEWPNPFLHNRDRILTSEILKKVTDYFSIKGVQFIIDAACASSLASVEQACYLLDSGQQDIMIAAGAETNLAPGSFSLFSRVGGLAMDQCAPFDSKTEGLVQGEGAGVVVLKRLVDAIKDDDQVLAIIRAIDGSSDGKTSSLFQPNEKGQKLAFARVYSQLPDRKISYLEGHGTGTVVGDKTEINAASEFFIDENIYMASVKGLTGHTKATAGVANIIKGIYTLRDKTAAGMKYINSPLSVNKTINLINKNTELKVDENTKIGVSAFGFGGTNYHAVIQPFLKDKHNYLTENKGSAEEREEVYLLSESELTFSDFQSSWFTSPESTYRVPPQSIPYIDKAQLLAVKATELAMQQAKLKYDEFPNEEVMVISSSILGLDIVEEQTGRVRSTMMIEAVKKYVESKQSSEIIKLIEKYRNKITPFSEDSAAGVLNNVIAGRICNAFDFHGRSYNLEVQNDPNLALKLVYDEIAFGRAPVIFFITLNEKVDENNFEIKRTSIRCQIFSSRSFVQKNFCNPRFELKKDRNPNDFSFKLIPKKDSYHNKAVTLFPGQGSIFPNRYVNYISYSETFKKRFLEADALALKFNVSPLSELAYQESKRFDSAYPTSEEALERNLFQFTVEVTLFDLLLERGIEPAILTGHSFGEFPALYCSGIVDFAQAFEIVYLREKSSPVPGELGSLVVTSISKEKFENLKIETPCTIANINSREQIVLAVSTDDIQSLISEFRKKRVPAKELKSVGRPYHSNLMANAVAEFKNKISKLDLKIKETKYDFISSVSGKKYSKGYLFSKDELINLITEQLMHPVFFDSQIKKSLPSFEEKDAIHSDQAIQGFIELGLDRTLCGFVKTETNNNLKYTIVTAEELLLKRKKTTPKKIFKLSDNKYVDMVAKIVSTVTGYKIEEISLEQQFEEDLRIDSIKKAEIFFRCLEETQGVSDPSIEVSSFKQVGDVVEFFQKNESILKTNKNIVSKPEFHLYRQIKKEAPLLFSEKLEHPEIIKIELKDFDKIINDQIIKGENQTVVLDIKNLTVNDDPKVLSRFLVKVGTIIKNLTNNDFNPTIVLYSRTENSIFLGLRSFLKSLRLELRSFNLKSVVDSSMNYLKSWKQETEDQLITDVIWENGKRFTPAFDLINIHSETQKNKIIFSVGGTKGILKQYFSEFQHIDNNKLILLGRSGINEDLVQSAILELQQKFTEVHYIQLDAQNEVQIYDALEFTKRKYGKIDILIDASGSEFSKLFENKSNNEIETEIASKILVRQNFQRCFAKLNFKPQSEIYFNSVAALYGNHGQSVYAFVNGFVSGNQSGAHLYWPPLDSLGMTADKGILMKLKMMGADLLPKNEVTANLNKLIENENSKKESNKFNILSLRNHFYMNLISASAEYIQSIFGETQIIKNAQFVKVIDKNKDKYLQDHVVNSNCIAPGSMGLAAFMLAGKAFLQRMPMAENFQMHNFILLDRGPIEMSMAIEFKNYNEIKAKTFSKYDNYEIALKENKLEDLGSNLLNENLVNNISIEQEFELSEFYSKKFIDYGSSFKVLNKVGIAKENKIYTSAQLNNFTRTNIYEFDLLTTLYEACIQTAATKCLLELKGLALPTGLEQLIHSQSVITDTVYMTTSELRPGIDQYNFLVDVAAYNSKGNLILKMKGVKLKKFVQLKEFPLVVKKSSEMLCQ